MNCDDHKREVLIIGFGNRLRGDDALGRVLIDELRQRGLDRHARLMEQDQLTPELAELISEADVVIFLDAACDEAPGTVRCRRIWPAAEAFGAHDLRPAGLLAAARQWFRRSPEAWLFTVSGESFEYAQMISKPVKLSILKILTQLEQIIIDKKIVIT